MHIETTNAPLITPEPARLSQAANAVEHPPVGLVVPTAGSADRRHDVEISNDGLVLSHRVRSTDLIGMDPARLERIRGRILSGAYDTLRIVDAVARRLLDAEDLL